MMGTLSGALEARGIKLGPEDIGADVEGINEVRDGIVTLTHINVNYKLRIPAGSRETVDRALSRHKEKCPTAHSLKGAVEVEWTADITENPSVTT
jgi:organic hydroperoxide reductase OsmC/OhrA